MWKIKQKIADFSTIQDYSEINLNLKIHEVDLVYQEAN